MQTIENYISSFPEEIKIILEKIRETIKETNPDLEESISYGIPTFKLHGKILVHFAGFKNHIGFYPTPSAIEFFASELINYKISKGTIQFSFDKVNFDLIKRIAEYRISNIK